LGNPCLVSQGSKRKFAELLDLMNPTFQQHFLTGTASQLGHVLSFHHLSLSFFEIKKALHPYKGTKGLISRGTTQISS
jgi:hypothetical protein